MYTKLCATTAVRQELRSRSFRPGAPPRGGTCSLDPLIFLDFIPCSPSIKPLVPKNVFSSCSLDSENFCAVPSIPKTVYHCSPYLFACFTLLFIVEKIAFEPPLSSPWNPLMLYFIDCRLCHLNLLSCLCDSDDFIGMVKHIKEKDKIIFFKL